MNNIINDIEGKGYAELPFGLEDAVNESFSSFKEFLKLDLEQRKQWTFPIDRKLNSEIGYVPREEETNQMTGHPYDYKDVFHFDLSLLNRAVEKKLDIGPYKDWFDNLTLIYNKAERIAEDTLKNISINYPDIQNVFQDKQENKGVLRLLNYHMINRDEGVIGLGHVDEWLLTINIAENLPGLKVGAGTNSHILMRDFGIAIVYPGRKLGNLTSNKLKPLYHEVVRTDGDVGNRMALTFFFDR